MKRVKPPMVFDRPVAWVCRTVEVEGKTEVEVERKGMSRAEILANFPPHWSANGNIDFGRKDLIKAIIYEAYQEARSGRQRPRQNIRGFWYERIFYTLISIMGEPGDAKNIASIDSSINEAWGELVEEGWVTYSQLNLYSEKEDNYRIEVKGDSPYPTAIVMVEKASLYDALSDLASTYEISFCCTGGQNSRAAALAYAADLERKGIDLARDFTVYSFCDYDPEGWIMPERFIDHLRLKVTGDISLIRLGVLKEHIGDSVIKYQAIPYSLEAENKSARKAKQTKYDNFVEATGGLFIPGSNGDLVPARVELNIYTDDQIREKIIEGLSAQLDSFAYQVRKFKEEIKIQYGRAWGSLGDEVRESVTEEYEAYFEAINNAREELDFEESNRAIEERAEIATLQRRIYELERTVSLKTNDLDEKRARLRGLEAHLENMAEYAADNLLKELERYEFPGSDDLITRIESNGGWHHWAYELSLTTIDSEALTAAAKQHRTLVIRLSMSDMNTLHDWIRGELDADDKIDAPDLPPESPEELVAQVLDGYE